MKESAFSQVARSANMNTLRHQERILLIKLPSQMCQYYHEYLEFMGFEVYCTANIEEALQILDTIAIDLVIYDTQHSQGQAGLQTLLDSLQSDEFLSIIALTSSKSSPVTVQRGVFYSYPLATNTDEFFNGNLKMLITLVKSVLGKMRYVLILNDSYQDQMLCEKPLMKQNYHLYSTCNGYIALHELMNPKARHVDFLILDLCNRYHSGFMLLSQLKQAQYVMPVFVVTALEVDAQQILDRTGFQVHSVLNKHQTSELSTLVKQSLG